jgi:hypothetical protein
MKPCPDELNGTVTTRICDGLPKEKEARSELAASEYQKNGQQHTRHFATINTVMYRVEREREYRIGVEATTSGLVGTRAGQVAYHVRSQSHMIIPIQSSHPTLSHLS